MKLMLLTPGTGHFFCGSCLRDNTLGRALRKRGHDVQVVPLYLPHMLESQPEGEAEPRVHMGGINMYLQQKSAIGRRLPRWLADLLDSPGLLRWAAKNGNMTDASDLGEMTLSMLRGEDGRQRKEVEKLVAWVREQGPPDLIFLSNAMLIGVARRLKTELGCPIVTTLQGEGPFLDALPDPFREQAWAELRERAREIDLFVPVSRTYGDWMVERLGLPKELVSPVHNAIDLDGFPDAPTPLADRPPTIAYLARMCADKGLHTLVEAFCRLWGRGDHPDLRLQIAGVQLNEDREFVSELEERLERAGCRERVTFEPNVSRDDKIALLASSRLLSVPATYGESFGLYLLEAMAAGTPVVQPRHGAFPEILDATGGGALCEPDDPDSLADGLAAMLEDEVAAQAFADRGRAAVLENFTAERMAREVESLCCAQTGSPG